MMLMLMMVKAIHDAVPDVEIDAKLIIFFKTSTKVRY